MDAAGENAGVETSEGVSGEVFQQLWRTASYPYPPGEYARRFAWEWVQRVFIRPSPRKAHGWRRLWLRAFGATVPRTSGTKASTRVQHPWLLKMGEHTMLAEGVTIYNLGPVAIGSNTVLSQDVYVCAGTHDYTKRDMPLIRAGAQIGSGVWVCAGAFIGPGVSVGDNAIVGARAVVMKDVPAGVIVAGNPAKVVRARPMNIDSGDGPAGRGEPPPGRGAY